MRALGLLFIGFLALPSLAESIPAGDTVVYFRRGDWTLFLGEYLGGNRVAPASSYSMNENGEFTVRRRGIDPVHNFFSHRFPFVPLQEMQHNGHTYRTDSYVEKFSRRGGYNLFAVTDMVQVEFGDETLSYITSTDIRRMRTNNGPVWDIYRFNREYWYVSAEDYLPHGRSHAQQMTDEDGRVFRVGQNVRYGTWNVCGYGRISFFTTSGRARVVTTHHGGRHHTPVRDLKELDACGNR